MSTKATVALSLGALAALGLPALARTAEDPAPGGPLLEVQGVQTDGEASALAEACIQVPEGGFGVSSELGTLIFDEADGRLQVLSATAVPEASFTAGQPTEAELEATFSAGGEIQNLGAALQDGLLTISLDGSPGERTIGVGDSGTVGLNLSADALELASVTAREGLDFEASGDGNLVRIRFHADGEVTEELALSLVDGAVQVGVGADAAAQLAARVSSDGQAEVNADVEVDARPDATIGDVGIDVGVSDDAEAGTGEDLVDVGITVDADVLTESTIPGITIP